MVKIEGTINTFNFSVHIRRLALSLIEGHECYRQLSSLITYYVTTVEIT